MVETLWFRAATIAVPIAGGFILIVLVLLASRMLSKENKRHRMAQVIGERYLKAPLYPGGSAEPLPHLPLYYHAPLSKTPSLAHSSHRASYEDKPCNYRHPDIHICSLEEIKPLNILYQERDTDSPLPSWRLHFFFYEVCMPYRSKDLWHNHELMSITCGTLTHAVFL